MNPKTLEDLSEKISSRFQLMLHQHSAFDRKLFKPLKVALYRALPLELNLNSLQIFFQQRGAEIFFPRVRSRHLEFVSFSNSTDFVWEKGSYGIEEPHSSLSSASSVQLDWIFTPGVAFGLNGERIGRGAGYYDRFLSGSSQSIRIALAFDLQVFPDLPQNLWDQKVDWLISESHEFKSERFSRFLEGP